MLELVELDVEELALVLELVLDEVDTLPLDVEVELDVDTLPLEVETPLDVETLPLEVETPPVEVETPPVEVETLPLEVEMPPVEVDVELPPVDVDVPPLEMVMVLLPPDELPPKKPPAKKPPPKPPPKPPEPPITTGTPPLPVLPTATAGGGGGGTNIGGMMVRVVTAPAAGIAQATRRTVRRTTRRSPPPRRTCAVRAFACLMIAGRCGGFSATWTAPPPRIAPPAVQAHNFARAIRTDIIRFPFPGRRRRDPSCTPVHRRHGNERANANLFRRRKELTSFGAPNGPSGPVPSQSCTASWASGNAACPPARGRRTGRVRFGPIQPSDSRDGRGYADPIPLCARQIFTLFE